MFSANLALTAGIVVHLIGYFICNGTVTDEVYTSMSGAAKVLLCLYPNMAFWIGMKVLMHQEGNGVGSQWSNLFDRTLPNDPITMGVLWIMLLVDVLIFAFLTWYVDSIKPGPFGVAKKWYFLFQVCTSFIVKL